MRLLNDSESPLSSRTIVIGIDALGQHPLYGYPSMRTISSMVSPHINCVSCTSRLRITFLMSSTFSNRQKVPGLAINSCSSLSPPFHTCPEFGLNGGHEREGTNASEVTSFDPRRTQVEERESDTLA
jgi:hypothetical protein